MKRSCIGKPSAKCVAKMEDVLEVYQRPYDPKRPVVCFDEKSKELHATPHGQLPLQPGKRACQDYEYERNGTCKVFLAVEPLQGRRTVQVTDRRTAVDVAALLRQLVDAAYAEADVIVLISDNLHTHTSACLYECFAPDEARRIASKLEWHSTPEHGSWLKVAQVELSVLARQCLNRRIPHRAALEHEVAAWEDDRNTAHVTITWQFTTADARIKLKRLYPELKVITSI